MNKLLGTLALLLVLMAASTPSREAHVSAIEAELLKDMKQELNPQSGAELIGVGLASMLGGGVVKTLLNLAQYNNYVVLSTMSLPARRQRDKELLSLGLFGQVILLKELDSKQR